MDQAELALNSNPGHLSDALMRHVIEHSKDAIMVVDAEQLVLLDVDQNVCQMLGYTRDQLLGQALAKVECSLLDVFFWEDLKQVVALKLSRVAETEWMRSDGSSFHVEKRVSHFSENGKNFWIIHAEDITRRRLIEEQQVQLASQLQSSMDATAEGIMALDLDGKVVNLNRRFATLWSLPEDILVGRSSVATMAYLRSCLIDGKGFSDSLEQVVSAPQMETEDLLALSDGRYFVCVSKPEFLRDRLIGRVFSVRDITAMKKVETDLLAARDAAELASLEKTRTLEALQVSESRLRRLLNSSLIGIMQGEIHGRLTEANEVLLQLLGVSRKEFIATGLDWLALTAPDSHADYQAAMLELRAHGQAQPFEVELMRQDGSTLPVMVGLAQLEGSRVEWVGFVLDLTEQRKADRLKADFISMVSHELRTPLTSIRGALSLLEHGIGGVLPPKIMDLVKIAHKNSQRLGVLVNDLLDMEKLASGNMAISVDRLDLMAITHQALEANAAYAQTFSVEYRLGVHPEHAWVNGDSNRLMQVFANLLSNAAKFAPSGDFVEIRIVPQDATFRVEVEDRGSGIPLAFRERIFSKFAQADDGDTRQQGGTGLGLNISKTLIEKMGGEIGFESEEGRGTLFWFTLVAGAHRLSDN
ncbi:PAS domain S-box protein [Undibacterium sp.]|uniref:PAS domain-containing sensor histidine kinase n=1 Tax=Undibacterium sp. TaxID=1914977 RepID=UPI0026011DBA|nr:PAS domain S-box protein [Undibacterium sp.]